MTKTPSASQHRFAGPRRVIVAWIGVTDLHGPEKEGTGDLGPIAQALEARAFDEVVLLPAAIEPADEAAEAHRDGS